MDREIIIAAAAEKYYTARRHFEAIGMCNTFGLDALERSKLATRYEMARSDMIAAKRELDRVVEMDISSAAEGESK